jgi:YD repeat-containing protein
MNRLIRREKVTEGRERFVERFGYDRLNQKISSTDIFGHETKYFYDEFGRLVKTISPEIIPDVQLITQKKYDILGAVIESITPTDEITKSAYNIKGQLLRVDHPDGTKESFEYDIDGNLVKKVAKNGTYSISSYDYKGRIEKSEIYSSTGELLTSSSCQYNAFQKLSEIDPIGQVTNYTYDGSNRLIQVQKGSKITTHHYDSLGREIETRDYVTPQIYIAKKKIFDPLNRVTEEWVEDNEQKIHSRSTYHYDVDGNRSEVITYSDAGVNCTQFRYDIHNNLEHTIDALGQITKTSYNYAYQNAQGQKVAYVETIDPIGNITVIEKDPLGRIVSLAKKNLWDEIVQAQEIFYDLGNRIIEKKEKVFSGTKEIRQLSTVWQYDPCGRLEALIEAKESPLQK